MLIFKQKVVSSAMFLYIYGKGTTFDVKYLKLKITVMPGGSLLCLGTCSTFDEGVNF